MPLDPAAAKARLRILDIALVIAVLLVLAAGVFQLFLRYTYVHTAGNGIVRVDRVSGDTCVMPCSDPYNGTALTYKAAPSPRPEKMCHGANVVRVAGAMRPPVRRSPTPYAAGGYRSAVAQAHWAAHRLDESVELSDGHIYSFTREVFGSDVVAWTTGEDVQVCATWSKLEQRPYYSVGIVTGQPDPATLAL